MTVYLVEQGCQYEGGWTCGVFTTEEAALDYASQLVDRENESTGRGNELTRKDHEPGGYLEDYPFEPRKYYVPVDPEKPSTVAAWADAVDYVRVSRWATDPTFMEEES